MNTILTFPTPPSHSDHSNQTHLLSLWPFLTAVQPNEYPSAKLGAKNIRIELKRAYPKHKFTVTSATFSGGDAICILWELGPTTEQVEAITDKYREGSYNSEDDIWEFNHSNHSKLFGGAHYISLSRRASQARYIVASSLCDLLKIEKPEDGKSYHNIYDHKQLDQHSVMTHAINILLTDAYPTNTTITGIKPRVIPNYDLHGAAQFYQTTFTANT